MRNLALILFLSSLSSLSLAQVDAAEKLSTLLSEQSFTHGCGLETKTPTIKKGEVKIAYLCEDFPVPSQGVDQEEISFYDFGDLDRMGLIIRSRVDLNNPATRDVTTKFRPKDQSQRIELEKILYDALDERSDRAKKKADAEGGSQAEKLKCEADVSYGPNGNRLVNSCSWTTTTSDLNSGHQSFAQMSTGSSVPTRLKDYDMIKIHSQSWKIKTKDFPKGISAERWNVKNTQGKELCILELSAKFEVDKDPKNTLPERLVTQADLEMTKLLSSHPQKIPAKEQGNKTGKAVLFARSR